MPKRKPKPKPKIVHQVITDLMEYRLALGKSQEQFARDLNIPTSTLRNWEQGRTRPDLATASFIRMFLDSRK